MFCIIKQTVLPQEVQMLWVHMMLSNTFSGTDCEVTSIVDCSLIQLELQVCSRASTPALDNYKAPGLDAAQLCIELNVHQHHLNSKLYTDLLC